MNESEEETEATRQQAHRSAPNERPDELQTSQRDGTSVERLDMWCSIAQHQHPTSVCSSALGEGDIVGGLSSLAITPSPAPEPSLAGWDSTWTVFWKACYGDP